MNGRTPQFMIDPLVDLGKEPATLAIPDWIVPLTEPLRRDHWKHPVLSWEERLGINVNEVMGFQG